MKVSESLQAIRRLFLDTAPVIYYVEENPSFLSRVEPVFDRLDAGALQGVASPITLAECLIAPYRTGESSLAQAFRDLILDSESVQFIPTDFAIAERAAALRARYNLLLPDSFQAATALVSGCDAVFTNDPALKRLSEIKVLVLGELEPD